MNVLSLFDGMSCGQIALNRLGVKVDKYFASEVDKYAIQVAKKNFPNTVHLGDVCGVTPESLNGDKIDLLIGGSPCQGFSFAGKRLNFEDPRSKLFFEYVRLLRELKPKYFLMENVKMKKESEQVITDLLGVEPIKINSNLVSAQNRKRLYWTNLPVAGQPEDKGIVLADILECGFSDRDKAHCLDANYFKGGNLKQYFEKHRRQLVFNADGLCHVGDADLNGHDLLKRVYHPAGKAPTPNAGTGGNREPKVLNACLGCNTEPRIIQKGRGFNAGGLKAKDGKCPSLTSNCWQHNNHLTGDGGLTYRKLTPTECERLQTVPEGYTEGVSNTQRYKMLGNGWTVDVICHLMQSLVAESHGQIDWVNLEPSNHAAFSYGT